MPMKLWFSLIRQSPIRADHKNNPPLSCQILLFLHDLSFDRSPCSHLKHVVLPRLQVHVQAGIPYLIPTPVIGLAGQHIAEAPCLSSQFVPRYMDTCLSGFLPVIDNDEIALIVFDPAPGQNVQATLVVGPAAPLTEAPMTVPDDVTINRFQELLVEGSEIRINALGRATAQKDRQPHLPSLELPLMQKLCPGEGEDHHCCSAPFPVRKRG